jgi:O-antigen/teichoic acid export membrane protein
MSLRWACGGAEVVVASIGSEQAPRWHWRTPLRVAWRWPGGAGVGEWTARLRALFADGSDSSLARRLAGTAFLIRVASAAITFVSQILLARWMGGFDFGVYIYGWTWLLLIGGMVDLGLGSAAQRFIPEYTEHKRFALLRGFLSGSRWLALLFGAIAGLIGAAAVWLLTPHLDPATIVPLYLSCAALPSFGVWSAQSGIARSYNWVNLGLLPIYVQRPLLLLGFMGLAYALGLRTDAIVATALGVIALVGVGIGQIVVLNRRLARVVEPGPKAYATRTWLTISGPIFVVEAFFYLLNYSDVIVLAQFRPANEVAIYYAAAKTIALVSFIYYSVAQTIAHRFVAYDVSGNREGLTAFLKQSVRLTFWPSLVVILGLLALGHPLLRLFGREFVAGYDLMFIMAVGLLARAAVGPAERLLNMLGERHACAIIYATSFAISVGLCVLLIPRLGLAGAATASSIALVFESASLFLVAKYRLGLHCLIVGAPKSGAKSSAKSSAKS